MTVFGQKIFKIRKAIVLIVFGSLIWSLTMVKSGLLFDYGVGFWGPNGHDGVWHLALIKSLARGSFDMPVFSGEILKNYHIGFDLVVAAIHKLTFIPVSLLYFQITPPIIAALIGIFAYKFVCRWTKSKSAALWSVFFVYFGGSWGWVLTLIRTGEIGGESLFWSQQSISTLINPPFALSLAFLFAALTALVKGLDKNNKKLMTLSTFLFGVLVQIKVYAGLLALCGLFAAGMWQMISRKGMGVFKVFAGSLIISILLFNPFGSSVENAIVYKPFWFLETMMLVTDRVYWPKFAEAMINYKLGNIYLKGVLAYFVAFAIFLLGNLGTRVVGFKKFADWIVNRKEIDHLKIFFVTVISAGIVVPTFFVQKGTPWNTIQFMYYSLVFSGVLAGIAVSEFTNNKKSIGKKTKNMYDILIYHTRRGAPLLLMVLTLPTTAGTLRHYLPKRPPAMLPAQELEALRFLESQPDGIVLTYPYDQDAAEKAEASPPRPLYLYESTAYVSAYSDKSVFLEDEVNLNITGYEWRERREMVFEFINQDDRDKAREFLKENNIEYIYWIKGQRALLGETQLGLEQIFENSKVYISKVL